MIYNIPTQEELLALVKGEEFNDFWNNPEVPEEEQLPDLPSEIWL
jgi:hypothetical protein